MYRSTFFDLGTSWRWVVSFTPLPLYPQERAPDTHFLGGWVDPRAGLDDMEKWNFFFVLPGLELPLPLVVQPVASRYNYRALKFSPASCHFLQLRFNYSQTGLIQLVRLIWETKFYTHANIRYANYYGMLYFTSLDSWKEILSGRY
jgi:hypothetical protein